MIYGLSVYVVGGAFAAVLLLGALGGVSFYYYRQYRDSLEDALDTYVEDQDGPVQFTPPDMRRTPVDYLRVMRYLQRAQRMASKGYVRWYRLGSTLSQPKWVKPKQKGSGTPKVTIDGQPYYFPKDAMVADEMTGAWVAMHREGEADPINLRDPAYPGIEADLMERIINLEAEDKPPGFLDNLDLSNQALLYGGMALLFLVYAAFRYMG